MSGKTFNLTKGVLSFNGRKGSVVPEGGDYTPEMIGAASLGENGQIPSSQMSRLTSNTTLYINSSTGSDSNPGTQSAPFATVQAAVDSLPKDLGCKIAALKIIGDVADSNTIEISDFYGGAIQLAGEPGVTHCSVPVEAYYCTSLTFYGMTFDTPSSTDSMMLLADCAKVGVSSCTFEGTDKSKTGILCANQTNLGVSACTFNNLNYAIDTTTSSGTRGAATVSVYDCSGSGNTVAVNCTSSAICVEYYMPLGQIGADTTVVQSYGGIVFNQNGTLYTG